MGCAQAHVTQPEPPSKKSKQHIIIQQSLEDQRSPRGDSKSTINSKRQLPRQLPPINVFGGNPQQPTGNSQNLKATRAKKIKIKE